MKEAMPLLCTISVKHLASDGMHASAQLPGATLHYVGEKELHTLLRNVAALAPAVAYPAEPEIQITAPTGKFVVRVKAGQLTLVSWASSHKGGAVTPDDVMAAVRGESAAASEPQAAHGSATAGKTIKEKLTIATLALGIIGVNAFTVWLVTRPPRTLEAKYQLLAPEQGKRVLEEVAGVYETGRGPGDRRLEVGRDASLRRVKYGTNGTPKDPQSYTVQAAEASGKKALVTNRKTVVQVKDSLSVVMYGDTYTRVIK